MRSCRHGLTIVELLVILFCLFVVLALLLPAVHQPRPHHRNQCATQIKNLALAAIQYENTRGSLPGYAMDFGTWTASESPMDPTDPDADTSTLVTHRKIGTWAVGILPWLDAQPTYEHWTQDRYPIVFGGSETLPLSGGESGFGFTTLAAPNLAIFQCPNNPNDKATHGRNSYVCNAGMYQRGPSGEASWQIQRGDETVTIDFAASMKTANGVFNNKFAGLNRSGDRVAVGPDVTLDSFTDGQSNTALISENLQAMPWHRAGFIDAGDLVVHEGRDDVNYEETSRFVHGMVWHFEDNQRASGATAVNPVHLINGVPTGKSLANVRMTPAGAADLARPSSAHVNGVNMGMADGATRFINDTIDYRVYQALLTPNGAESDVPQREFVLRPESF